MKHDQYYVGLATHVASRSHDHHTQVGAVVVRDDSVVATGFNGTAKGRPNNCKEGPDERTKAEVIHAELNAIIQAARDGRSLLGSTMYSTLMPCEHCAAAIINAGIERVVYRDKSKTTDGMLMMLDRGISVVPFKEVRDDDES